MNLMYRNLKNGKVYEVVSFDVINKTNEQDGQKMVVYIGDKGDGSGNKGIFVREIKEFESKFVRER